MSFMQPQIYYSEYYLVETDGGDWVVPIDACGIVETLDALGDYVEGSIDNPDAPAERQTGWIYRLSAPGYLDATDWGAAPSELEAIETLLELYGSDTYTIRNDRQEDWEGEAWRRIKEIQDKDIDHHLPC